nr:PAS domain-containing hybrid sensor histidine kinase/response regulator [Vibrio sinus]
MGWLVVPLSLVYLSLLFLLAWYGDRRKSWLDRWRPWIYSLSLGVYCTSWAFFGTIGEASVNPWSFLPVYIAPIIVFVFGWRILAKLIVISKRENVSSIADFIAARYGKSHSLATVLTVCAVIGVLPYIALQIKGIILGLEVVSPNVVHFLGKYKELLSFSIVCVLALFTILFGNQHLEANEQHRGLTKVIAFESIIKLLAYVMVGAFAIYLAFSVKIVDIVHVAKQTYQPPDLVTLFIHTLLAGLAIICLPRQFHMMVVENEKLQDLKKARVIFPLYLLILAVFVLPIAWAGIGLLELPARFNHVLTLPLSMGQYGLTLFAFIGGLSAAFGMVVVSTIALSIMVSNEIVVPYLLRRTKIVSQHRWRFTQQLISARRLIILLLMFSAWLFYLLLENVHSLAEIGFLSFAAVGQFAPALIGGMYWRLGNRRGVYSGLAAGFFVWLVTLMYQLGWLAGDSSSNFLLWVISPSSLWAGLSVDPMDWGMLLSLLVNALFYVVVSLMTRTSLSERLLSAAFIGSPMPETDSVNVYQSRVTVGELELLASRFVGRDRMRREFREFWHTHGEHIEPNQQAPSALIRYTEKVLASVFGVSSAKLVLTSALQGRSMQLEDIATIMDEASEIYDFSRGVLQGAIEHLDQGIAVIDKQHKLVAWNQRYQELFNFPSSLVKVGRPFEEMIQFNTQNGLFDPGEMEEHVRHRIFYLEQGKTHTSTRKAPGGRVIEVHGSPMPGGGFVMRYTDITEFRKTEQALKQANETLEERVLERTQELQTLNRELVGARQKAEYESKSKSRFLAAVSHDLMQPLNAARLFASSLSEVSQDKESRGLSEHIESALNAAEDLISDLLDISRLESGKLDIHMSTFAINDVLCNLNAEFGALSAEQNIHFNTVASSLYVKSDAKLLRRVIQNFLTNAFRYNPNGKVLLGVRREQDQVKIEVWDNGQGIDESKQREIFDEFTRGHSSNSHNGLGLGLAISKGIANVLGHQLAMQSRPGCGSVFSITLPKAAKPRLTQSESANKPISNLQNMKILCVDNEETILVAMQSLLERWGCDVRVAPDLEQSLAQLTSDWAPAAVLSDYRLDGLLTGIDVLTGLKQAISSPFLGVIISADRTETMTESIHLEGFEFIPKPVKAIKLRAMLNQCIG